MGGVCRDFNFSWGGFCAVRWALWRRRLCPSFQFVDSPDGLRGLSADGTKVLGGVGPLPSVITLAGGAQTVPALPGYGLSHAEKLSRDGSTAIGWSHDFGKLPQAYRWTQA